MGAYWTKKVGELGGSSSHAATFFLTIPLVFVMIYWQREYSVYGCVFMFTGMYIYMCVSERGCVSCMDIVNERHAASAVL